MAWTRTFKTNVFPQFKGKRLSELTTDQMDDAHEDWIRANHAFARDPDHIAFLLCRIDELREKLQK